MIKSLKDLDKLIQLCQKRGVSEFKIDNIEFKLSDSVLKPNKRAPRQRQLDLSNPLDPGAITVPDQVETDELSEEQLLYYSASSNEGVN